MYTEMNKKIRYYIILNGKPILEHGDQITCVSNLNFASTFNEEYFNILFNSLKEKHGVGALGYVKEETSITVATPQEVRK